MTNFDQDELMLADLSTDYNADDIIDHINVNELIYSSCNNFAAWTNWLAACCLLTCLWQCAVYINRLIWQVKSLHHYALSVVVIDWSGIKRHLELQLAMRIMCDHAKES